MLHHLIETFPLISLFRLRSLQRQIGKEDERRAALLVKRAKEKLRKMAQPKVLGKVKYEPPQVEVNLSEEISGSLRTLKVEGNVLLDRYKSLQRRNIIEPRLIQRVVRKYKPKKYAKHSHKDAALRFGDGGRGRGIGRDTGRPAAAGSHAARRKARKARPKHWGSNGALTPSKEKPTRRLWFVPERLKYTWLSDARNYFCGGERDWGCRCRPWRLPNLFRVFFGLFRQSPEPTANLKPKRTVFSTDRNWTRLNERIDSYMTPP